MLHYSGESRGKNQLFITKISKMANSISPTETAYSGVFAGLHTAPKPPAPALGYPDSTAKATSKHDHTNTRFSNSAASPPRSRRDRSKQLHSARVQRRATTGSIAVPPKRGLKHRPSNSLPSEGIAVGLGDNRLGEQHQVLTKMAFAEQQQWITVQQKTFTKW